jgi:hypothetical protein
MPSFVQVDRSGTGGAVVRGRVGGADCEVVVAATGVDGAGALVGGVLGGAAVVDGTDGVDAALITG